MIGPVNVASQQQRTAYLRAEVAMLYGRTADHVVVERDTDGAPVVAVDGKRVPASVSRSGSRLLFGLADRPVGVDVEAVGEAREPPWRVLATSERIALREIADPVARHLAFLRIWTAKEAILKALGTGLARAPESVAVTLGQVDALDIAIDGKSVAPTATTGGVLSDGSDRFVWRAVVL